ncbi:MAG: protein jag [Blautia sp.]|nr:protein jag [Blautia sp.]
MEEFRQFSAKTKNEAITKACIELGTSSDQLEIEVVNEGSSGFFFGIGSKPATIRARKKEAVSEEDEIKKIVGSVKLNSINLDKKRQDKRPEKKQEPKPEKKEKQEKKEKPEKQPKEKEEVKSSAKPEKTEKLEKKEKQEKPEKAEKKEYKAKEKAEKKEKTEKLPKEKAVKPSKPIEIITDPEEIKAIEECAVRFLKEVFDSMDLGEVEITSQYNGTDGCLEVMFNGEDMGILIGKRGQTLDSLQYLTSLVVNKGKSNYVRVKLDTEDYRRRRKETLENLARGIAYKVRKTRKPVVLEPMNPYERRIIHSALQGNKYVETISEGEDPYRHVVVKAKRY